jgi:hypothetical protein
MENHTRDQDPPLDPSCEFPQPLVDPAVRVAHAIITCENIYNICLIVILPLINIVSFLTKKVEKRGPTPTRDGNFTHGYGYPRVPYPGYGHIFIPMATTHTLPI